MKKDIGPTKRSYLVVLSTLLILSVVAILTHNIFPQALAQSSANVYTNKNWGIQFQYPLNWTKEPLKLDTIMPLY